MSGLGVKQKQAKELCALIAETDAATLPVPRPSDYMMWPWDTVASSPTFDFPAAPADRPTRRRLVWVLYAHKVSNRRIIIS